MNDQKYTRLCGFLVLLALLVINTTSVFACTQPPPTPWFDEYVTVVSSSHLPAGMKVQDLKNGVTLENDPGTTIYMKDEQGDLKPIAEKYLRIDVQVFYASGVSEFLTLEGDNDKYEYVDLKPRNVFADHRPAKPTIPEPQTVTIDLWVVEQAYTLQLQVNYELNRYYSINSLEMQNNNGCARFNWLNEPLNLIISALLLLIVVLVLGSIVFTKKIKS